MIEERLKNVNSLTGKFKLISRNEVIKDFIFLRSVFKNRAVCVNKKDFSNSTNDEITKWFEELNLNETFIKIYWHSYDEGICTEFETFVKNFDEIWYPSSDDIWIVGEDKSWLIQIDHEEKFCLFNFV